MLVAGRSDEEATLVAEPRTARGRTLPPLVVAIAAVLNADLENDIVAKTVGRMMVWQLDVETLKPRRRLGNQGLDRCAFPQLVDCVASWAGYDGLGRWRAGEGLPARCSLSVSLYVS